MDPRQRDGPITGEGERALRIDARLVSASPAGLHHRPHRQRHRLVRDLAGLRRCLALATVAVCSASGHATGGDSADRLVREDGGERSPRRRGPAPRAEQADGQCSIASSGRSVHSDTPARGMRDGPPRRDPPAMRLRTERLGRRSRAACQRLAVRAARRHTRRRTGSRRGRRNVAAPFRASSTASCDKRARHLTRSSSIRTRAVPTPFSAWNRRSPSRLDLAESAPSERRATRLVAAEHVHPGQLPRATRRARQRTMRERPRTFEHRTRAFHVTGFPVVPRRT